MIDEHHGQSRLSVRGLWKLFGRNLPSEITSDLLDRSKADLRENEDMVVGLKDVSFDVEVGETFVVMGLSGSGKSTLVRILTRLIEPTFGEVIVDDEDILKYDEKQLINYRRTKTAMVFQHFGLLPHRTVEENAAWGLEVQGIAQGRAPCACAADVGSRRPEGLGALSPDGAERRHAAARGIGACADR